MTDILPWAFVATVPGLLLTAAGVGRRPGVASQAGPFVLLLCGLLWLCGDHAPLVVRIEGWLPVLPDPAFSLRCDALAAVMLCIVGAVSSCVYVYSLSYLRGDPGQRRYFVMLDFFVAAMSLLVLAGNLAVLVAGWAAVGFASFLLISFWRDKSGTLGAGLQALTANAIGDAALIVAAMIVSPGAGDLTTLHAPASLAAVPGGAATLAALLVVAAAAKSAQGPFYFWLPSAMAGPTPVSALIHAATMVAAGIYLLCRTNSVLALAPDVRTTVAWLGVATAMVAAVVSLQQANYKRGLAYSTLSQLGYMFAAIGFGAPFAAFFHLFTHASCKALLFLVAGVVIHATDGEERLEHLGGLRRQLPWAAALGLVGSLALIGLPVLTAGAFSKDLILAAGIANSRLLGGMLLAGVLLTGLYTGRLWCAVFLRGDSPRHVHAPDSLLLGPLLVLAVGAIGLGWCGPLLGRLLEPVVGERVEVHAWSGLGALAGGLGIAGFALAWLWVRRRGSGARLPQTAFDWVDGAGALAGRAARGAASLHGGRLGAYLFCSLVGIGSILLLTRL